MINLEEIKRARENLKKGRLLETPLSRSPLLSKLTGKEIFLKKDNLQITGSFKVRGAFNRISNLTEEERNRGVVAASAGNHAQGVALSAQYFGIPATIVMPENTPLTKINGVRSYGAEVILEGLFYDDAYKYALKYAKDRGNIFVHPFEDSDVIAGQGTVALEVLEKIPHLDAIIVPIGGGGLISGVATAIKSINPNIKVIGVGASGAPALKESFLTGEIVSKPVKTIADGIAVRDGSPVSLEYMKKYVDEVVSVDDEEIASAILYLLEKQKVVSEGAGAVGVAGVLHNKIDLSGLENIAIVVSGGNIDVTMLSVIIEKGLVKSNRKLKMIVTLIDKPGSLKQLTDIFDREQANIVHIGYDRTTTEISYGDANVTIHIETKGAEHQNQIAQSLIESGFKFQITE